MFLFTDGIEESRSNFLDKDWENIRVFADGRVIKERIYLEEQRKKDAEAEESSEAAEPSRGGPASEKGEDKGEIFEELTPERMETVINTFFAGGTIKLEKKHFPIDEEMIFDFSACERTPEGGVLALMAVEKIWRIIPAPNASATDKVTVDRKIDEFLRQTFNLYGRFFSDPEEDPNHTEYLHFPFLREDAQEDDLTILAVRKL